MKKSLIIFGANGHLGQGVTKVLCGKKDFDSIYLFARNFNNLEGQYSNAVKLQANDLSKEENVKECFTKISPAKDTLFFLFSTIGGYSGGKYLWEWDEDDFEKMMNLNVKPAFLIAKYFSALVKESAGGSICFTAAMTGVKPEIKKSLYGASKGALIHLVQTLAIEGKEINLTANAIAPYIIDTPENRKWMEDADFEKQLKPEEIGGFIYNIFCNFNFISGNILTLTGRLPIL